MHFAKVIPYFRGVFMRDELPLKPLVNESMIINLEDKSKSGSHWVALRKRRDKVFYYDSYGDLPPPKEVLKYLGNKEIFYNYNREQGTPYECGHLALEFLLASRPKLLFKNYK